MKLGWFIIAFIVIVASFSTEVIAKETVDVSSGSSINNSFPQDLQSYNDATMSVVGKLEHRISESPFNFVATLIFLLAIVHTFLSSKFMALSHAFEKSYEIKIKEGVVPINSVANFSRLFHFLGEIEVVFGLWAIVLMFAITCFFDWSTAVYYVSHNVNYTEAMFVVAIMALASTRPILKITEAFMNQVARLFGGSLSAWWLSILTLGPLLGSFITEPAAITISALLLSNKFYSLEPSIRFKYATLGLLFVNISVGGTLTHFAAPPVLMVAEPWGWGMGHMLTEFGWKAIIGILISHYLYWFVFRQEFEILRERFEISVLKEGILKDHLPRETLEREIDTIVSNVKDETGFNDKLESLVGNMSAVIEEGLKQQFLERIAAEEELDERLATEAFNERFNEIKLYRMQREFPHLLPQSQRAPFRDPKWNQREDAVPLWVMLVHVVFMAFIIINAHHPALFIAALLFFLGFAVVTADYQNNIDLKSSLLVGFFLGGLVTHGGVQGWWIEPVLGSLSEMPLMLTATVLTAFNDNAAITYLSTLVPGFTDELKYAVVAGAVTGGGLTVIANAPNPAGQTILNGHFENGISPFGLLKAALIPTIIMFILFLIFR
ncbi:MAG: putative Na+/H+ antiporter [Gammaproteobacteria bacterium]